MLKKLRPVILSIILICSMVFSVFSFSDVYVRGYYRSDGTYVRPHYRTSPNSTINDNYSTAPNINPYTGEKGTIQPEYGSYYVAPSTSWTSTTYMGAPKYYIGQAIYTKIPTFNVVVNGIVIDSKTSEYPLFVYNGITYFPMTFHYAQALGLATSWNQTAGFGISKSSQSVNSTFSPKSGGNYSSSATYKATIPSFKIKVNGKEINNQYEEYPLLVFRDITYFPMTWRYAVTEFGLKTEWSNTTGFSIIKPNMPTSSTTVAMTSTSTQTSGQTSTQTTSLLVTQTSNQVANININNEIKPETVIITDISDLNIDLEYEIYELLKYNLRQIDEPEKVQVIGLNALYQTGDNFVLINLSYPVSGIAVSKWFFLILNDFVLESEYSFVKGEFIEYTLEKEQTVYPGVIDTEKVNSMLKKYFNEIRF